jgi:hypothetical protein
MHRNALRATDFFRVPDDLTVEMGLRLQTAVLSSGEEPARLRLKDRALPAVVGRARIVHRAFSRRWRAPARL